MCFVKQYIWIMVYLFKTLSGFFWISPLLYEFYVLSDQGTTLLQECLILSNCFCKDLISKQGHVLRYFNIWTWGKGMGGSGEHTIQPTMVNVLGFVGHTASVATTRLCL